MFAMMIDEEIKYFHREQKDVDKICSNKKCLQRQNEILLRTHIKNRSKEIR